MLQKRGLAIDFWYVVLGGQSPVAAVTQHFPGLAIVCEIGGENLVTQVLNQFRALDREQRFNTVVQIARHEVGAAQVNFLLAAVAKIENAAVLEESSDNAHHANILANAFQSWPQATDAAHDEVHLHAGL